ncbi:hypothetical protein HYS82_02920, partial [Candidatus Amesbacteria bacterium]|nr:hypothetical protein [Candidatus Amesbacteria bacterium]
YITGGKQGSHLINETVFAALPLLLKNYHVIHQTGSNSVFNDHLRATGIKHPNYEFFDYDSPKAIQALADADVVVSRAGAHIVYELGVLGKKCVLIPLPHTSHSEQLKNAQALSAQAVILPQARLSPHTLVSSVTSAMLLRPQNLNLPLDGTQRLLQLITHQFK